MRIYFCSELGMLKVPPTTLHKPGMQCTTVTLELGRGRQEDRELKSILGYIVNWRPV